MDSKEKYWWGKLEKISSYNKKAMIQELTTYIAGIKKQFPLKDFVPPKNGLHIMLEVENGNVKLSMIELYQPKKDDNDENSEFLRRECMPRELHIDYIESHEALVGKEGKKIHSASPFALIVRKKSFDGEWQKWFLEKKLSKNGDTKAKEEKNNIEKHIEAIKEKEKKLNTLKGKESEHQQALIIKEKLEMITPYYKDLIQKYFKVANDVCVINYQSSEKTDFVEPFQKFCSENLPALFSSHIEEVMSLKKDDNIIVLLKNMKPEQYEEANSSYLKTNIFVVDDYNQSVGHQIYGLSGYRNTDAPKKPYLKHLTAPFDVNYRTSQQKALLLNSFEQYRRAGAFKTNPLPIFIDHAELNNEVVNVVKTEGNKVSFHQVIRKLYERKKSDLGNYYLFYFLGMELKDGDFVSSFSYELDIRIRQVIPQRQPELDKRMDNVFQFEIDVLQPIFNNQLIQKRNDQSIGYRYFDDIDNNAKYITDTIWNLLMKYRMSFYDFIYKSRRQAVTTNIFHDIMRQAILDDIRHDEVKNEQHTKTSDIRKKLNIWFSLWSFFEKKTNDLTMANKIEQHQDRIRILQDPKSNEHVKTDDEFAFAVGQVIYYLLDQSKAGNKTHALLEPFLQKTDMGKLKKAIANTFNAFKHEISFGKGRFEKLCGDIMAYELNGNLKELMPCILAGYFSNSLIYEKSEPKKP